MSGESMGQRGHCCHGGSRSEQRLGAGRSVGGLARRKCRAARGTRRAPCCSGSVMVTAPVWEREPVSPECCEP